MPQQQLLSHFSPRKNLTAERYRLFCTKPTSAEESHDHWITRFRAKGRDCEFDKMNLDEAIKLVVTLHTSSEKLQQEIIAKDMALKGVTEHARALELTSRELAFIKQTTMKSTVDTAIHQIHSQQLRTTPFQVPPTRSPAGLSPKTQLRYADISDNRPHIKASVRPGEAPATSVIRKAILQYCASLIPTNYSTSQGR